MVTVALCLLLTAAPEVEGRESSLVPSSSALPSNNFDSLPPPAQVTDEKRVQRFVGALAGGVVGMGAGFALIGAGDAFQLSCFPTGSCVNFFHGLAASLTPLLTLTGVFAGYLVAGGEGSLLTTAAAMAPAGLIALLLLAIGQAAGAVTALDFLPYAVAASAFLIGGGALALHLRQEQVSSLGGAASWGGAAPGRVTLTTLVSLLTVGASVALTSLLIAASWSLGPAGLGLAVAGGGLLSVASTFSIYGVHRGLNGRGTLAAAFAGMGLALAASGAGLALFLANSIGGGAFFSPIQSSASVITLMEIAIISGTFFPMLALEWSHTQSVKSSLPGISFGAAPLREGGMVSAAVRF
ncbi:MAG: hypothetical protein ACO1OB_20480 [Archangium sp.]